MANDLQSDRRPSRTKRTPTPVFAAVIAAAAGAALAAPLAPTGSPVVDAVERALVAAAFVFVAAHGRRTALLWSAILGACASRDVALALSIASLGLCVVGIRQDRRRKALNAVTAGLTVNALLWVPAGAPPDPLLGVALIAPIPALVSGRRQLRTRHRVIVDRSVLAVGAAVVTFALLAGVGVLLAAGDIRSGADAARDALERVRDGDTDRASRLLEDAEADLGAARSSLRMWTAPGRSVPVLSQNIAAASTAVEEARSIAAAGGDLVAADYEDLRYEGAIDLGRIEALAPPAARASAVLERAGERLSRAGSGPIATPLADRLRDLEDTVSETARELSHARAILDRVPSLMGRGEPRRYLIVFTQPAELRGAGGFIGNWLDLEIHEGKASIARSGRIADLIDRNTTPGRRTLDAPPDYVRRYGRLNPHHWVQDATLSPDWPSVARTLAGVYPQAGGVEVDGVVGIDPAGLAALLELTGPVPVEGLEDAISADNAVDLLTRTQYLDHTDRASREEILDAASRRTFEELTTASLPSPRAVGAALGPAARGRHIQVWLADRPDMALMEDLGVDGALHIPTGHDGFQVVQQNAGNNKIDAYLRREVVYDVSVDPADGTLTGSLSITLHNEVPSLDLPDVVVGNERGAPRGTNLATISVHAPWVVTAATIDGRAFIPGHGTEAGLNAWDTPHLSVPASGSVTVTMQIEGVVDLADGYRLTLPRQAVVEADSLDARVRLTSGSFTAEATEGGGLRATAEGRSLELVGELEEDFEMDFAVSGRSGD